MKYIPQILALVLALGIASAQTTLPTIKVKAGQTTFVEIAQLYSNNGDLTSQVKLIGVRSSDSSNGLNGGFQALDEGIPGGWNVYVSSSQTMAEEVNQPAVENTIYNNFVSNTYGISIPQGVAPGQYAFELQVRNLNTGDVSVIPIKVEVTS